MQKEYHEPYLESRPFRITGGIFAGCGVVGVGIAAAYMDGSGGIMGIIVLALIAMILLLSGVAMLRAADRIMEIEMDRVWLLDQLKDAHKEIKILSAYEKTDCDACCVSGPDYGVSL